MTDFSELTINPAERRKYFIELAAGVADNHGDVKTLIKNAKLLEDYVFGKEETNKK